MGQSVKAAVLQEHSTSMNRKTRVIRFDRTGGPEVLQIDEIELPPPKNNEVLLKMDALAISRADILITYWNRGTQELYGWTAEEAIGKRAHELLQSVFPAPTEEIRAELLRSGRWDGELEKTRADGTQVVVSSRWSLRRGEQGRPAAILETNNDITERERREQEIRTLNEELGKPNPELPATKKELEDISYSISQDLRAALPPMAGFT